MTNRAGEFVLVIDPGNEDHLVRQDHLNEIMEDLTAVIRIGIRNLTSQRNLELALFHSASPEHGSVRFNLVAAAVALAVAADLSQLVGANLLTVFQGVQTVLSKPAPPPQPDPLLEDDPHFVAAVERLVETAAATGYSSVRIETPDGLKIELIGASVPPSQALSDLDTLEQRLAEVNGAIAALDVEISHRARGGPVTAEEQRHGRHRRDLVLQRNQLEVHVEQAKKQKSTPDWKRSNP